MPVGLDPDPKFAEYAHPERLVTTAWLAEHLGEPGLVVVESRRGRPALRHRPHPGGREDRLAHRPQRPGHPRLRRRRALREAARAKGIARDTTVVIYGDKSNWWAAYALWVFALFGHEDVRLLDGGRAKWIAEGRELTTEVPAADPGRVPRRRARRRADPRLQGRRARAPRQAAPADRRPLARRSTPASAPTCRTTRRRARCAAGTSRRARACRGRAPPPRTATFKRPRRARSHLLGRAGPEATATTSSPTAGSASARATPGSC